MARKIERLRECDATTDDLTAVERSLADIERQERIADVRDWCNRVAKNIDRLTYAEKRDALVALGVRTDPLSG